ncbi:MAG: hypothetical protein JOZ14_13745 [Acidobacteria bacterium]|nr:hypothetical protein [Acidobacteriota bacterium]
MAPINGFHFCDHAKNTFAILASGELRLWACVFAKNIHFVDVETPGYAHVFGEGRRSGAIGARAWWILRRASLMALSEPAQNDILFSE